MRSGTAERRRQTEASHPSAVCQERNAPRVFVQAYRVQKKFYFFRKNYLTRFRVCDMVILMNREKRRRVDHCLSPQTSLCAPRIRCVKKVVPPPPPPWIIPDVYLLLVLTSLFRAYSSRGYILYSHTPWVLRYTPPVRCIAIYSALYKRGMWYMRD
jgi:hypothetical protein